MKAERSPRIPRKHTENLMLLTAITIYKFNSYQKKTFTPKNQILTCLLSRL